MRPYAETQVGLFEAETLTTAPRRQLLKWIGSKNRFAQRIVSVFPEEYGTYFEPFLGSGAVLATLGPKKAIASDTFDPLMEIWKTLQSAPEVVKEWYSSRWQRMMSGDKVAVYEEIKASYNARPNAGDLLFLTRSCYGGVVRFRRTDGYMSTPCGVHSPILPHRFAERVEEWRERVKGTSFRTLDYREALAMPRKGDIVYCDPPYSDSQTILYGAQSFSLDDLLEVVASCKKRGAKVALSIDGSKKTGRKRVAIRLPAGLFVREIEVAVGRSMLRRFQMRGKSLEEHEVLDRLLLTW